jgi:uncharacterized protein YutE (UPF0331/DUF86 family)
MTTPRATRLRTQLDQSVVELAAARSHLNFSHERITVLAADLRGTSAEEMERAEAYTSRFSRSVDLLVSKVLRGIDSVEMLPPGTLLDVANRAEKRGLVAAAQLREMKAVRNEIAHDYAGARLAEIFAYCREQKPEFDALCDRTMSYIAKLPAL